MCQPKAFAFVSQGDYAATSIGEFAKEKSGQSQSGSDLSTERFEPNDVLDVLGKMALG